ncbi:MAG: peptidoglycan DD-metalloendopeptidase family protein [Lentimicrobiaceae bacterium]|nr:peptidoglycan DD-metalloendopeptidase family protein [Lentimicrobiaceae bacterium]
MIIERNIFISLIICLLLSVNHVLSQQLFSEPAGGMNSEELYEAVLAPIDQINHLPDIFTYSPVTKYYDTWDTLYVTRHVQTYPKTDSIVLLPIFNHFSKNYHVPNHGDFLSPFGYRGRRLHAGVDIRLNKGDSVKVAFDGVVRLAKYNGGYGNCVVVRHFNGIETLYAHLSKIEVGVNQAVRAGDVIGLGGSTGRSTCNHLHFETRFQGKPFNPRQIFDFENNTILVDTLLITNMTFRKTKDYVPKYIEKAPDVNSMMEEYALVVEKNKNNPEYQYYKVKKGDNLSIISRKHNVPISELCKLNGISKNKIIRAGTYLKLYE